MSWQNVTREIRFISKKKSVLALLMITFLLTAFAVVTGMQEVKQQNTVISDMLAADAIDRQSAIAHQSDYGGAAYYSFHLTYSPPSPLAFAALGERDNYPWKHRIRMLALEGQIYESDTPNPELAYAGQIDYVFVLAVLSPLLLIMLLHDMRAFERTAGRYDLLCVTAGESVWRLRALVVYWAVNLVLLVPFVIGALVQQVSVSSVLAMIAITALYTGFWTLVVYWFARANASAPRIAAYLLGIWLTTTYLVPALGDRVLDSMYTGPLGGEIVMTQREAVNDGWDKPVSATMDAFVARYPEWAEYTDMPSLFDWKWYYAFQQVGDQTAEPISQAYRQVAQEKYRAAGYVALLSPATLVARTITAMAHTDATAARAYESDVRAYHEKLREFYYPLLFKKPEYDPKVLQQVPEYQPRPVE